MTWLRLGWVWAIACAAVLAGGGALVMRFELLDPGPTLSPEGSAQALALHGLLSLGVLAATVLAIPMFVVRPGRGAVVLGFLSLGLWTVVFALLAYFGLARSSAGPSGWLHHTPLVLAASLIAGAIQLALSLPANLGAARWPQLVVAVGALGAIAILVTPLVARALPTSFHWLLATTALACALLPDAVKRLGPSLASLALVPCLGLAWATTVLVHRASAIHVDDTVAALSSLPALGGALFGALVVAATRARTPHRKLVHASIGLVAGGAIVTSYGFYVLGTSGLPRRYFAYLPEFQAQQVLVGVAAVSVTLGCALALEAFRRGRPT